MRVISYDPFARYEVIRETVYVDPDSSLTCEWCGNPGRVLKDGTRVLYRYGVQEDGIYSKVYFNPELFHCVGCYRLYML